MTANLGQDPVRRRREVLPWQVAARWADPDYGSGKPPDLLTRLSTYRSVLGMLTLIAVGLYTGTRTPDQVLTEEGWDKTSLSVVIAVALVPAFMIGTFLLTRRGFRQYRWWPTLWRIGMLAGSTYALMTPMILAATGVLPGSWGPPVVAIEFELIGLVVTVAARAGCGPVLLGLILGVPIGALWLIGYILSAVFWANRTSCWAGRFHPLLAPTVSAVLVCYFTVAALAGHDTGGLSAALWLVLTWGGLITTLALAITEHETLRRREGYRWRGGPAPMRP